ncbi:family 16 glycosylhydrolase [Paraglaciecola aquimarina]|uniref:Family 16 glycosylhydrolase n=1 Tax=Paraglaciecola algarum TaxID=3050085 RepID=A0ABS9D5J7_9ALTE|nr:family 16 glycosylhydrolase [Paraglaciecola sp. G1-23]MCF2948208.1 family 16 glycosylhydrolase [Paraglaciecola sp. G1-23]
MWRFGMCLGALWILSSCSYSGINHTNGLGWQDVSLPENINSTAKWELIDEVSDNFNYVGKTAEFYDKWHDNHIRGWKGPGATYFSAQHSALENGLLVLSASAVPEPQQGKPADYGGFKSKKTIYTGFVTAKRNIEYPIFVEASMKISSLALASNFWMLSDDDKYEIDVTETYGDTDYNAKQMSTNYHIFKRDPGTNDYLEDYGHKAKHYQTPDKALLNKDFHRFGFYWKSPKHMEFYLDGKLVRVLSTETDLTDPDGHFFDRPLRIIFDMEDHVWRAKKGITPSLEQLDDPSKNKMYVDWTRAYRPVSSN